MGRLFATARYIGGQTRAVVSKSLHESAKSAFGKLFADFFLDKMHTLRALFAHFMLDRVLGIQYLDSRRACALFLLLRRLSSEKTMST